ncbi:MAG: thioredoxin domain-containing protein [Desulfatiglandales bacterium]|nr:thioredoxin domain-containing protein [Desulfatiglandales bacterium]
MNQDSCIIKYADCGSKNRILKVRLYDQPMCGKCHTPLKLIEYYDHPVEMTGQTFRESVLSFQGPLLMVYYSPGCGYCKMLDPVLDQIASEYAGRLKVGKINVDQNTMTASQYNITVTPAVILFRDGKEINKFSGSQNKEAIESQLRSIL